MNEIDAGRKAELLLNDEVFTDAVDEVMLDIKSMWMESESNDDEGREALYRELHGLRSVIVRLRTKVQAAHIKESEKT